MSEAGRRLKAHFCRLIQTGDAEVGEAFDHILRTWGRTEHGAMALASALDRR